MLLHAVPCSARRAARLAGALAIALVAIPALGGPPDTGKKPQNPNLQNLPPSVQRDLASQQPGGPQPPKAAPQVHGVPPAGPVSTVQLKPGEEPKIEFDMATYDFGRIKAGADVVHDFWFTNVGNGPLEITQVKPS